MQIQSGTTDIAAAAYLVRSIQTALDTNKHVLWLVSGGSNISLAVTVRNKLNLSTGRLYVGLIDERFGPVGHQDSNWQQLLEAGFNFTDCDAHPILTSVGNSTEAAAAYADTVTQLLDQTDISIGLLGMGADAHIAGMLPQYTFQQSTSLYEAYVGPDYDRITATPKLLAGLDQIVLCSMGDSKQAAFELLLSDGSIDEAPVRMLRELEHVTIYTNVYIKQGE